MKHRLYLALFALLCSLARSAAAEPFLFFRADPPKLHAGHFLQLEINIGGLRSDDPAALLGAFQLTLNFDPRLDLNINTVRFGDSLGRIGPEAVVGAQLPPGDDSFSFFEVSLLEGRSSDCVFCTGPYLEDLQSDSFRLATVEFFLPSQPGPGPSWLLFSASDVVLSDADGNVMRFAGTVPLVVPVPEPPLQALLLGGLGLALLARRMGRPS